MFNFKLFPVLFLWMFELIQEDKICELEWNTKWKLQDYKRFFSLIKNEL